jgi:hypothetical protein
VEFVDDGGRTLTLWTPGLAGFLGKFNFGRADGLPFQSSGMRISPMYRLAGSRYTVRDRVPTVEFGRSLLSATMALTHPKTALRLLG